MKMKKILVILLFVVLTTAAYSQQSISIISSRNELSRDYYDYYYQFYHVGGLYEKYSDEFFEENFLIIIFLYSGRSNLDSYVERIDENGDIIINQSSVLEAGFAVETSQRCVFERSNSERLKEYRIVYK